MNLSNDELDLLAEALNARLNQPFDDSERRQAMDELADKIVKNQEADQ